MTSTSPTPARKQLSPRALLGLTVFQNIIFLGMIVGGIIGMSLTWHTRSLEQPVRGWTTTTGTVVGIHQEAVRDGYVYAPIVSFTDTTGATHQFTAPTGDNEPSVGDPAKVTYNPQNPAEAHDLSDHGNWAFPFATAVFLTCLGALGLFFINWLRVRLRRRARDGAGAVPPTSA